MSTTTHVLVTSPSPTQKTTTKKTHKKKKKKKKKKTHIFVKALAYLAIVYKYTFYIDVFT